MYPNLYSEASSRLAILDNIVTNTAKIKRVVNGEFTFGFDATEAVLKSEYLVPGNYVIADNQTFDIKYLEQKHEGSLAYNISAEHAIYRLADGEDNTYSEGYTFLGTPTEILEDVFTDTDFSVGTVAFTEVITLSITESVTKKQVVKYLANYLGGEVDYRDLGFTIDILDTIGLDNNYVARFGKNLKGLTKVIDTRGDEAKTYYKANLLMLKNTNTFKEKNLGALEVVGVGDTVRIIDSVTGTDVLNRVISIEYNPFLEINTSVEIANKIELFTDVITDITTNVVYKDTMYNNVSISNQYGFRSELASKLARGTFSGGGISLDVGDGLGGYTPAVYFDPLEGKYVIDGLLTADTIQAVAAEIDVVVSNEIIVNNLYASFGRIADLTVSELDTSFQKILYRKADNTDDISYLRIYEDQMEVWVCTTDGTTSIPYTNNDGDDLYWTDAGMTEMTTNDTGLPILVYEYEEVLKWEQGAELIDGVYIPYRIEGAGDGVTSLSGKTKLWKGLDGYYIEYYKLGTGDPVTLKIGENGIDLNGTSVFKQPEIPTEASAGSIWFDDDDYSTQDVQTFLVDSTVDVSKGRIIDGSGTIAIDLYSLVDESAKSVHTSPVYELTILNTGVGTLTINAHSGETIEGSSTLTVSSGSRKRLIGYGTDWKVI